VFAQQPSQRDRTGQLEIEPGSQAPELLRSAIEEKTARERRLEMALDTQQTRRYPYDLIVDLP
jgi:hypothetical protein